MKTNKIQLGVFNPIKYLLLISIVLLFVGCASIGVSVTKSYPAKNKDCKLEIFYDKTEITRPYVIIAVIDSRTGTTLFHDRTVAGAVNIAKPKACEVGADAILVEQQEKEQANLATYGAGKAIIKCIKYTDEKTTK